MGQNRIPDIFLDIYRKEDRFNAGSSHAITGYKVREDIFITIVHESYFPEHIDICRKEEHLMDDYYGETKQYANCDPETGEVTGNIPGIDTLKDFMQLVYIARYGEVVRDDC